MTAQGKPSDVSSATTESRGWPRGRMVGLVREQLTRGVSPRQISFTLAIGAALGVFPILGATTALCFAAATVFKLNHPVIQAANWIVAWAQLPLILVFARLGEWVAGAEPAAFSPNELVAAFQADPGLFLQRFGLTGLHAILGWLLTAPLGALLLHSAATPFIGRFSRNSNPGDHSP